MKIIVVSDLHVDIPGQAALPNMEGDVLIIAGDVSNSAKASAREINNLAKGFQQVLVVDGNHEHYSNQYHNPKIRTIADNNNYLKSMLDPNVLKLDSTNWYDSEEYRFIGNNGWYSMDFLGFESWQNMDFWKNYMNDHRIWSKGYQHQPFPPVLALTQSEGIEKGIEGALEEGKKPIIITHTVPHEFLLHRRPWDISWERACGFYLNNYNQKIIEKYGDKIHLWINGHTHIRQDKMINGIRCICNPRGYPGESPSWEPLELELD